MLRCAVLCCVVFCCAVFCCAVLCSGSTAPPGLAWGCIGAGQTGGFAVWVAGSSHVTCWWLAGVVWRDASHWIGAAGHLGVRSSPVGCPPLWPAPWSHALWGSLSLGVGRVRRGRVAWSPRLSWFSSQPVSLPPRRPPSSVWPPCPLSLGFLCPCVCVVAPVVEDGRGGRLAVRA